MAIYHLSVKSISRSAGRSVVAAAAYRAGQELTDERQRQELARQAEIRHQEDIRAVEREHNLERTRSRGRGRSRDRGYTQKLQIR